MLSYKSALLLLATCFFYAQTSMARDIPATMTAEDEIRYAELHCGENPIGFWETNENILQGHTQIFGNEGLKDTFLVYRICNMDRQTTAEIMASSIKTYPLAPFACMDVKFKKYLSVKSLIEEGRERPNSYVFGHYCKIGN